MTCLEQEYDFKEINKKKLVNIPQDTSLSQKANAKYISKIYNRIKHKNACTPEPSTHQDNNVFFDSHQYEEHDKFHDCLEGPINQKAFHLSIDYQFIANKEKGSQSNVHYIRSHEVDEMLTSLDWSQLIREQETFSTLAFVVTTSQKYHKLEMLQPMLLYKPIEVIKKTLEAAT